MRCSNGCFFRRKKLEHGLISRPWFRCQRIPTSHRLISDHWKKFNNMRRRPKSGRSFDQTLFWPLLMTLTKQSKRSGGSLPRAKGSTTAGSPLIQDNPWAVRRVLDALAAVSTTPNNGSKRAAGSAAPADATIDPLANPDLDQLQRVSPEALLNLFRLLKEAPPGSGGAKPQTPVKPASR